MQVTELNLRTDKWLQELVPQIQSVNLPSADAPPLPRLFAVRNNLGQLVAIVTDEQSAGDIATLMSYQKECLKTESVIPPVHIANKSYSSRTLHAAMGLVTEAGELVDSLKKHIFYDKPLDKTNLLEEAGDLAWYLSILLDDLGSSYSNVFRMNIDKLQKRRYTDGKFSKEKAINRDLDNERKALETFTMSNVSK